VRSGGHEAGLFFGLARHKIPYKQRGTKNDPLC
jgi:hypothetical protein